MTQETLPFDRTPHWASVRFDGMTYNPQRDQARLSSQCERVYNFMRDGIWRSLQTIAEATGDPESSVSARLRDLRKDRFGAHTVNRMHMGNGLYFYQLLPA
jgi:hypothetical protein